MSDEIEKAQVLLKMYNITGKAVDYSWPSGRRNYYLYIYDDADRNIRVAIYKKASTLLKAVKRLIQKRQCYD